MIGVLTTPRRRVSYLAGTLAAIDRSSAGGRRKIVFSDGEGTPEPPAGWSLLERPWVGARWAGWLAMRFALGAGAGDFVLFQDDVIGPEDLGDVADRAPVPDDAFCTVLYSGAPPPGYQPRDRGAPRVVVAPANRFTGAQAIKLPRRSLEYLVARDPFEAPGVYRESPHLFDDALFAYAFRSPWPSVAVLLPNVVRHVGVVSACETNCRHMPVWSLGPGERFPVDVASLPVERWRPPAP